MDSCVAVDVKIVWLSSGVSSFIAGYLVKETVDKWIYIDVKDQHPDSMRFIKDCEKVLGINVEILRSDKYNDVEDVVRKHHFINSPWGAACTGMLKKQVRKKWEEEQYARGITDLVYVWGMDYGEQRRVEGIRKNFPEFQHEFPLVDRKMTKNDCHAILKQLGIKRPEMYDLGYINNNCIGCVKGGMAYWNKIRVDFPEVFESRAKLERDIGHSCIKGVFLDELNPNAGRGAKPIVEECSMLCQVIKNEIKEERS